ncbi:DUF1799 domain-containing protein [Zavarzinia compransoris]|uniref:DUF1799 domain-containing protein n=1 Tax=Zavarzinia compransoris TaxID=1264899 RepID=UPI001FD4C759|nr:DUF1799 domain-containing protein [Zavarzinia compransoris]
MRGAVRHGLAARRRQPTADGDLAADLKASGLSPEQVQDYLASRRHAAGEDFEVWPENEAALDLWAAVEGRWVFVAQGWAAPMGGMMIEGVPAGLDMQAVAICAAALGQTLDRALLGDLATMEDEALKILAEQRAARR